MEEKTYRFVYPNCPVCNGFTWNEKGQIWIRHRNTTNMVCEGCGTDFMEEHKERGS